MTTDDLEAIFKKKKVSRRWLHPPIIMPVHIHTDLTLDDPDDLEAIFKKYLIQVWLH